MKVIKVRIEKRKSLIILKSTHLLFHDRQISPFEKQIQQENSANPDQRANMKTFGMGLNCLLCPFKNWINLYEPVIERESRIKKGLASYQQLYNAYQTPTMYLLDKDKNILAKRLSLEQFENMLKELNRKK